MILYPTPTLICFLSKISFFFWNIFSLHIFCFYTFCIIFFLASFLRFVVVWHSSSNQSFLLHFSFFTITVYNCLFCSLYYIRAHLHCYIDLIYSLPYLYYFQIDLYNAIFSFCKIATLYFFF